MCTIPESIETAPMETERLNILTWNVRLLKFGDIDAFLTRMSGAFENWGILLIQEFYSGAKVFPKYSQDGHRVFATWPHRGSRRIGIIVHKRFTKLICRIHLATLGELQVSTFLLGALIFELFRPTWHNLAEHSRNSNSQYTI